VVGEPEGEAASAFRALAETVDRDLAPKRRYHPELRVG
jgi:hypothetical protein